MKNELSRDEACSSRNPVSGGFRSINWLITTEPFSRTIGSNFQESSSDLRLRKVLKLAVERDLAPQTLIDSIRNRIRNADEPR